MQRIFIGMLVLLICGCARSTVYMADKVETFTSGNCSVQVFYSQRTVQELGATREVCTVEGSSAASFDHSLEGAIKKNLKALCNCGVDMAYIKSQQREAEWGFQGVSYVTLVGFKLQ